MAKKSNIIIFLLGILLALPQVTESPSMQTMLSPDLCSDCEGHWDGPLSDVDDPPGQPPANAAIKDRSANTFAVFYPELSKGHSVYHVASAPTRAPPHFVPIQQ